MGKRRIIFIGLAVIITLSLAVFNYQSKLIEAAPTISEQENTAH